jgi:hypothetical protein
MPDISNRNLVQPTVAQPKQAADAPAPRESKVKKAADNLNQSLGADGVLQDSTRSASLILERTSLGAKGLRVIADIANGETAAVDHFVRQSSVGVHKAATIVSPKLAVKVDRGAAPALRSAGRVFSMVSKYAQVLALPFAAIDVKDAIKEKDPKAKRAAIANATFSVVGGVAGAVGGFIYATPIGLPLLVLSTSTGVFQILDHFAWKGKGMDYLGEHVVGPVERLFHHH